MSDKYPATELSEFPWTHFQVQVTLRLTVSQSVNLDVEPHLGLMTRYLLLFGIYGLAFVKRLLWREDWSVFCIWCWPLPVQSFSTRCSTDRIRDTISQGSISRARQSVASETLYNAPITCFVSSVVTQRQFVATICRCGFLQFLL
jgi:hypothetical protein